MAARRCPTWYAVALAATLLAGCGAGPPVARGFGSREVLPIRDPTFSFSGWGDNVVDYSTSGDGGYRNGTIVFGPQPDAGLPAGDAGVVVVSDVYSCQPGVDAQGSFSTAIITDNLTGQQTTVDGVSQILQCPGADSTLTILRADANGMLTLWSGPFDALQQIPLSVTIAQVAGVSYGVGIEEAVLVLASSPAQPDAVGLFSIDVATFAVTMLVPPTLGTAAWASGAAATTSALSSASLLLPPNPYYGLVSSIGAHYSYERTMSDGSAIMFAGTFPTGSASELALFEVAPSASVLPFRTGSADIEAWQYEDLATQAASLFVWDDRRQQFAACSLPASIGEVEVVSNDATKVLFGASLPSYLGGSVGPGGPLALLSRPPTGVPGDSDSCTLLAPSGVVYAGFSSDSSSMFWVVQPARGDPTLWTAAADGSGARMIGGGAITQPHYAVGAELEFELDGDLEWVDTTDTHNHLHPIAEQIFGDAIDLQGSWVVIGYDLSTQDGTGTLGLVNRDTGTKRLIAPAVVEYELAGSTFGIAPGAIPGVDAGEVPYAHIAYLVRGRNPSPQDGVWLATISDSDLQ